MCVRDGGIGYCANLYVIRWKTGAITYYMYVPRALAVVAQLFSKYLTYADFPVLYIFVEREAWKRNYTCEPPPRAVAAFT